VYRPRTRRSFLREAGQLGIAATGLAVVRTGWSPHGVAAQEENELASIQVLMSDVTLEADNVRASSARERESVWQESRVVESPFPFTHLGLHWTGTSPARIEARTSGDGREWTDFEAVTVDAPPESNPRGEWFSALIGARRHRFAQYRVTASGARVDQMTLTFLNSIDGPRRPLGAIQRPELALKGADLRADIITREEWGADESIRFSDEGEELWERAYVAPRMLVVHHTATRNFPVDPAADIRAIYAFHTITRGWGDIGYNALIDAEGRIYEGRRGRDVDPYGRLPRDILSFGVVGAHASGYNYGSASVSLLGNFQKAEPTADAWAALEELLAFEHRRYEIDPRLTMDFARSTDHWRDDLPTLSGHRDCGVTECPGDFVYRRLPELRARIAERIVGDAPPRRAIVEAPATRNLWPGLATYRWQGAPLYEIAFEGFWKHPGADPVDYLTGYNERGMAQHTTTPRSEATYALDAPGHYTLQVRATGQAFADRMTVVVERQVVCDNANEEGTRRTGAWTPSRTIVQFYGSDYEQAPADSGAIFTWELPIPESGNYSIQACWTAETDRTHVARYAVSRDGELLGTTTVDQTVGGNAWGTLGTHEFVSGQTCEVTLSGRADGDGLLIADAIRAVLVSD